jgi:hypothetical protein
MRPWIAIACLTRAAACSYWEAPRASDTAPAAWPAVGAQGDAPTATVPGQRGGDRAVIGQRLGNLDQLHRDGVIGEAEYRRRRQELLDDAFD